jgi:hypothetical protein
MVDKIILSQKKIVDALEEVAWGEIYTIPDAVEFVKKVLEDHGYKVEIKEESEIGGRNEQH